MLVEGESEICEPKEDKESKLKGGQRRSDDQLEVRRREERREGRDRSAWPVALP